MLEQQTEPGLFAKEYWREDSMSAGTGGVCCRWILECADLSLPDCFGPRGNDFPGFHRISSNLPRGPHLGLNAPDGRGTQVVRGGLWRRLRPPPSARNRSCGMTQVHRTELPDIQLHRKRQRGWITGPVPTASTGAPLKRKGHLRVPRQNGSSIPDAKRHVPRPVSHCIGVAAEV